MRLAIVADIHGNLPALQAVIDDMAARQIDACINLGDCVSGPLWPRETLALLHDKGWPTVRGNHDRSVGDLGAVDLGPSDVYARAMLGPAERAWLYALPLQLEPLDGTVAMHARPDDDDAYLLEEQQGQRLVPADAETIRTRLGLTRAAVVLTGHSHLPRCRKLPDGPWIVNPGSVGCPAYDDDSSEPPHISETGSPAARYAILEERAQGLMVELLSLPYPHETAAARADANDRPDWAHALRTGYALPARGRPR